MHKQTSQVERASGDEPTLHETQLPRFMLFIFRSSAFRGIQDTLDRHDPPFLLAFQRSHLDLLGLCQRLNSGNSLLQKLLLERRLGDLGVDGGLNGLHECGLLGFPLLLLVSDPAVEDGLEFGLDGVFLRELEVGVLEGGGFLKKGTSGRTQARVAVMDKAANVLAFSPIFLSAKPRRRTLATAYKLWVKGTTSFN